ncbi:MAG: DUF1800 domain-containing protein [Chlorobi bacterium]|nr:DUF1800 domain-containing protein [Chlorobiota bacterium]
MNRRSFFSQAGLTAGALVVARKGGSAKGRGGDKNKKPPREQYQASLKGLPETNRIRPKVAAGLEPYVPSEQQPWDEQRVGHLLRRTMFGAKLDHIKMALKKAPGEVVDMLLADKPLPNPPGNWVSENWDYDGSSSADRKRDAGRMKQLRNWWIELMLSDEFSIREKLTLFWHDHFATEYLTVRCPQWEYGYLNTLRKNALGNFKQFVTDMTTDPAMLDYLDGRLSTKGRPNENYGRELQELFTMGVGNYTEDDIKEAARALTGWTIPLLVNQRPRYVWAIQSAFVPSRHDDGEKTFLGQTGNWDYKDIIDIIFQQDVTAKFICRKLYREFVYEVADETIVDQLAQIFRRNNYDLKPVLSTLFKSAHFFDNAMIGAHISNPLEFGIGNCRSLNISNSNIDYLFLEGKVLGMEIFQPPNVAGWPAYRTWISSSLLPTRWAFSDSIVNGTMPSKYRFKVDVLAYARLFDDPNDARQLVTDIATHLINYPMSQNQLNFLLDALLQGAPEYEWNIDAPNAEFRLRSFLVALLRMPESQLS